MSDNRYALFYFSGTHWDREWYKSFQGFRYELVKMLDELIDYLVEHKEFKVFHMDGQTIMLEDYLQIDDSKLNVLTALIQSQRILIGPWYCMPDEYLLSGESLIRNLMVGHKICRSFGVDAWKFGYACDIFGHIAQMPQIFNGFDIHYSLLGRGTNEHTTPAHFVWQSPDGSKCVTYKVPDKEGYGAFSLKVIGERKKGVEADPDSANFIEKARQYLEYEKGRSDIPVIVIMDAMDHEPVHPKTPMYIDKLKEIYPEWEIYHSDLIEMSRTVEKLAERLPVKLGELNETARNKGLYLHLISNTLSSYYPIKAYNDRCQTLMEKWVEPLLALGKTIGANIKRQYVDLAYKYLLKNHSHDSICGCSIDQVHKDMVYRFDQCWEICCVLLQAVENQLKQRINDHFNGNGKILCILNPLPFRRKETVSVQVEFEQDYEATFQEPFGYETRNCFKIFDVKGKEIPYGIASVLKNQQLRTRGDECRKADIYTLTFEAELPAMGLIMYRIAPQDKPVRYMKLISQKAYEAENEHIHLRINDNGTLCITDKKNGITYDNLLEYYDEGEIGDGWYSQAPIMDTLISSHGASCRIERIENGPVRAVFRVIKNLQVPEKMIYNCDGIRRSERCVTIEIISKIGLSSNARYVDVETVIDNRARDHRMKLVIPTGVNSDKYFVNQPFAFITRSVGIRTETHDWKEKDSLEKQMGGIVGKRNKDGTGLAFISAYGLHECAVPDDKDGSILVTLLRSFSKTFTTNGEHGCQIQGKHTYKYLLVPLSSDISYSDLVRFQDCLQTGIRAFTAETSQDYVMQEPFEFMMLKSRNILSSMIKAPESQEESTVIIRLYNMSDEDSTGEVEFCLPISSVQRVNFNEEYQRNETFNGKCFEVKLSPWKVATYKIKFLPK